jgi:ATP-dependent Clp protease ATP-binding subunit ClpB
MSSTYSALLEQERGLAASILTRASVPVEALKRRVEQDLDRLPKVSSPSGAADQIYITGRSTVCSPRQDEAKRLEATNISRSSTYYWR